MVAVTSPLPSGPVTATGCAVESRPARRARCAPPWWRGRGSDGAADSGDPGTVDRVTRGDADRRGALAGIAENRRVGRAAVAGREHHRDVVRGGVEERGIQHVKASRPPTPGFSA